MSDISDAIDHARRTWTSDELADLGSLRAAAAEAPPARSLSEVLSEDVLGLIVEPKRATLRRGTINPSLDVGAVALECERAGASAVSVVTEPKLSGGSHDDLRAARAGSTLPVIARDYVVDVRQVYALRAAGADALLTPATVYVGREPDADELAQLDAPPSDSLVAIVRAAHELGMEIVLSVQSDDELEFALETDVDVINIDNRDASGTVDVDRTFELLADVPVGWPVISESIEALDQVARLHRAGVDALLLDEGHLDTGLSSALAVYADLALEH
ncbi:MAG: Indole-3-glycerol-phosphate synthase [Thermoleophilia bacterium]|nr:Indole-3-glycerol-phosphate synthase [Thermoleophilia bacterium]